MKTKKTYPMNGPSLHAQKLMEFPRKNRNELASLLPDHMRSETRAVLYLK